MGHAGILLIAGPFVAIFLIALLVETSHGRWTTAARVAVPLAVIVAVAAVLWVSSPG